MTAKILEFRRKELRAADDTCYPQVYAVNGQVHYFLYDREGKSFRYWIGDNMGVGPWREADAQIP